MKSRFFADTSDLDRERGTLPRDQLLLCLRVSKETYALLMAQAAEQRVSSGEYIERAVRALSRETRRLQ